MMVKTDLFREIDNRYAQINYVINENADPWTLVPPGILNEQGHFNRRNGKIIEKANTGSNDNDVSLVTWDGQLTSAFEAIKSMMKQLFFTSRLSAPIVGMETEGGGVESGTALKWRSVNTLTALGKRHLYWSTAIKKFFWMLGEMSPTYSVFKGKKVQVIWQDGLPIDITERTNVLVQQVNAMIKSKETAIKELNEIDTEQAQEELEKINTEQKQESENQAAGMQPIQV
jgi:hypothetical protein